MKTAMTQLIEMLEKTVPEITNGNAIDKAFWIEMEKEQITEAVKIGGMRKLGDFKAEDHYNFTFTND